MLITCHADHRTLKGRPSEFMEYDELEDHWNINLARTDGRNFINWSKKGLFDNESRVEKFSGSGIGTKKVKIDDLAMTPKSVNSPLRNTWDDVDV